MTTDTSRLKLRELLFSVRMSIRYHRSRQMYFERWAMLYKGISILSATAVFASVLASLHDNFAIYASIVVALSHVLDLVTEPGRRAVKHHDFAQDFTFLEHRVDRALLTREHTSDQVAEYIGERLSIEAKEPPTLLWLAIRSRNDQIVAQNGPDAPEIVKIPLLQRPLLHILDFFPYRKSNGVST